MAANIVGGVAKSMKRIGEDDPRRIIHSMKVGLAVTLVSLIYFFQPLFRDFGTSTLWAVLTVVVVFEYSVGATLGKGLNRVMATFIGGALAVGVHTLATQCGHIGEPFLISIFVFLQAAISTFVRFSPKIKARYDYGFLIFILTFSLISVSGFRVEEILELARVRWATIVIGVLSSLFVSIFMFPVWAGEDLHNLVANNIEKLGNCLQGYGNAYFKMQENNDEEEEIDLSKLQTYKSVLNTKSVEENLANFARWEPSHGHFKFKHPWKQYLKLGAITRECTYRIDALDKHLHAYIKTTPKLKNEIREECNRIIMEASKTLKELASALKNMSHPCSYEADVAKLKEEVTRLQEIIVKSTFLWEDYDMLKGIIAASTIASILTDILNCTEKLADCVSKLASLARFKEIKQDNLQSGSTNVVQELDNTVSSDVNVVNCSHLALMIE